MIIIIIMKIRNSFYLQINISGTIEKKTSNTSYMEKIFNDSILTDVSIVTDDGGIIRAHKCILARSPVFLAMFQNDMMEKKSNQIHVKEIKHDILKQIISFMYSNKVEILDPVAGELMIAADYYDLPDLKDICLKSLELNINMGNFAHSLFVAERLGFETLKDSILRFVVE